MVYKVTVGYTVFMIKDRETAFSFAEIAKNNVVEEYGRNTEVTVEILTEKEAEK